MNRSTIISRFLAMFIILSILLPTSLMAASWQGTESTKNGIHNVINPYESQYGSSIVQPKEVWRTNEEESEDELKQGFITDIKIDEDGDIYLLDSTLNVINVHSPNGDFLRQIGREGEGPGEFRNVNEFMLMPNGNFGVLQMMPAKVVTMDRQGIAGNYFSLCNGARGLSLIERAESKGQFLAIGMSCGNFESGGVDYFLAFVDSQGEILQVIQQKTEIDPTGNINIGGFHENEFIEYWTLASDGRVFVAPQKDQYRIEVFSPMGELIQIISREFETIKRSKEDLAEDKKRQDEMDKRFGGMVQIASSKYERDISEMHFRPNGELWVTSSAGVRDCPKGTIGFFDVFDKEGKFLRQVGLEADFNPKKDDFLLVGDNLFVLKQARARPAALSTDTSGGMSTIMFTAGAMGEDEDEEEDLTPPSVVCYRLP
ncbi:MAG: 6-bladed beta-propeller [bacterium]|nr:6-bladed beta-propeller [bacterium]